MKTIDITSINPRYWIYMAMAQNDQPPKWMVFLLNMIISVGYWYHNFEPNPYGNHQPDQFPDGRRARLQAGPSHS